MVGLEVLEIVFHLLDLPLAVLLFVGEVHPPPLELFLEVLGLLHFTEDAAGVGAGKLGARGRFGANRGRQASAASAIAKTETARANGRSAMRWRGFIKVPFRKRSLNDAEGKADELSIVLVSSW